ncbi:MAG TPA: calcium-binding protein [Coleofasciculaceae cyanobacterium]|jgi:Ca2+-binding RTX toxin-like protein
MTDRFGTPNRDILYGDSNFNALNDAIYGYDGNDVIFGREGDDRIDTGNHNDLAVGNSGNDTLIGGAGNDFLGQVGGSGVKVDAAFTSYLIDPGNDWLEGSDGSDMISGGEGSDRLLGGNENDILGAYDFSYLSSSDPASSYTLNGADAGNDQIDGGTGDDYLSGGEGNDRLSGGAGTDVLGDYSLSYNLTTDPSVTISLAGSDLGNDRMEGGAGSDRLHGGLGNDQLVGVDPTAKRAGFAEVDELTGGAGRDTFVLGSKAAVFYNDLKPSQSGNTDYASLKDFNFSEGDRIQLRGKASHYALRKSGTDTLITLTQGQPRPELIGVIDNRAIVNFSKGFTFV